MFATSKADKSTRMILARTLLNADDAAGDADAKDDAL
jgi:hypothetical protein